MGKMLGTKLIDLRRNAGLTQEEAANKLEELCRLKEYPDNYMITRSSLANNEKGIRTPNLPKMILLSDFYSTEVMDLILISDDDLTKGFPLDFSAKLHKIQQEIMNSDNTTVEKDNKQDKIF